VLAAGLDVGIEIDRARARRLRNELRRHEALARASRSLAHRDLSERELSKRLEGHVDAATRKETVDRLVGVGAVDDARLARGRAELLARRGAGDLLIRHDLDARGIRAEDVQAALEGLEPETVRARRIVEARGRGSRTARYLARKGFSEESIESVCEEAVAEDAPPVVR